MTAERDLGEWAMETLARSAVHMPHRIAVQVAENDVRVSYIDTDLAPWVGPLSLWNAAIEMAKNEWQQMCRQQPQPRVLVCSLDGSP